MGELMADRLYEVRINGLVPTEELLDQLRDVRVAEHEFRTVLSGHFRDQGELHAFLNLLRSYGLEVIEVRRVPRTEAEREAEDDTDGTDGTDSTDGTDGTEGEDR
jgi:hypothetical protein